jgi:hypothetical protein
VAHDRAPHLQLPCKRDAALDARMLALARSTHLQRLRPRRLERSSCGFTSPRCALARFSNMLRGDA